MKTTFSGENAVYGNTEYRRYNGIYYHINTPMAVVKVLDNKRLQRKRIRISCGDVVTGQVWEYGDEEGYVGNSTGPLKVPLLIYNSRSTGGGAILDHCIVRIATTGKNGVILYQHPKYQSTLNVNYN